MTFTISIETTDRALRSSFPFVGSSPKMGGRGGQLGEISAASPPPPLRGPPPPKRGGEVLLTQLMTFSSPFGGSPPEGGMGAPAWPCDSIANSPNWNPSNRHLSSQLNGSAGGDLEEVGGVGGIFHQEDEQMILP